MGQETQGQAFHSFLIEGDPGFKTERGGIPLCFEDSERGRIDSAEVHALQVRSGLQTPVQHTAGKVQHRTDV